MKRIIQIICCIVSVIPFAEAAADEKPAFVRYIDRPLQEVKGSRVIYVGCAGEKQRNGDSLSLRLSQVCSYAVNDRVMFSNLPWPTLRLLVKPSLSGSVITDGWDAFALSVRFGMTATLGVTKLTINRNRGFPVDYSRMLPLCEVNARMILQTWLWAQCDALAATVSDEAVQGYVYPQVGFQIAKYLYGTIGYRGGFFRFSEKGFSSNWQCSPKSYYYRYAYAIDYYHSSSADEANYKMMSYSSTVPVTIGVDLGTHVAAILSTSAGKKTGAFVPVQLQMKFKW